MFLIAKLWWLAVTRRGREESFLLVAAIALFAGLGFSTFSVPAGEESPYLSGLFGLGLLAVMFVPELFRGRNVLDSPRFRLLPYTSSYFYLLRSLFGNPFRTILGATTVLWGTVGLFVVGQDWSILLGFIQVLSWTLAAMLTIQIVEDALWTSISTGFKLVSILLALVTIQLLLLYPDVYRDLVLSVPSAAAGSVWIRAFPFAHDRSATQSALSTGVAIALLGALILAARVAAEIEARPELPRKSRPTLSSFFPAVAARIAPESPAGLAKELSFVARLGYARAFLGISFVTAAAVFYFGIPWLLPLAFIGWITFMHNLLGGDLPLGGDVRYQLIPIEISTLLRRRHAAIVLSVSATVFSAAVFVTVVSGKAPAALPTLAACAFGLGCIGFGAVWGDWFSTKHPKEIGLRTMLLAGGFVAPIAWLGVFIGYVSVVGTSIAVLLLVRSHLPGVPIEHAVESAFLLATCVYLILYAISRFIYGRPRA